MAWNEICKHCGHKEGPHDMVPEGDAPASDLEFFNNRFGNDPPCRNFESEISHKSGCPVFGLVDGQEVYCQDLPGGCTELINNQEFR